VERLIFKMVKRKKKSKLKDIFGKVKGNVKSRRILKKPKQAVIRL